MISMDDVAEKAKVSKMTVSRVLNGSSAVSSRAKAKVLTACQELNYRINHSIQDLVLKSRNGTARNIAFVLVGKEFADPAYAHLVDWVAAEVNRCHYQLLLVKITGEEKSIYEWPPVLRDERIDGLLITGELNSQVLALIKEMSVESVVLGNYSDTLLDSFSSVQVNFNQIVCQGVEAMKKQGCTRLAFVLENPENYAMDSMFTAFRNALQYYKLPFDPTLCYWGSGPFSGIYKTLEPVFMQPELPFDGIFCHNYRLASEISQLALAHFGIGNKMALTVCTTRNFDYYKLLTPTVYIDINQEWLVNAAFKQLVGQMENKSERQTIVVNCK